MKRTKTNHERQLLKRLKSLNGKVKYNHNAEYDGKRQSVALIIIDNKFYQGTATLSEKDQFNRKLGRAIALGRAFKNYDKKNDCPNPAWGFKDEHSTTNL